MKCPVDEAVLQMTERRGVEIDYCPQCRGVWLDRGELDKIIEADLAASPPPAQAAGDTPRDSGRDYYRDEYRGESRDESPKHDGKPTRRNLLGELFDF
jgi:Zn-finger nucleic acid-binding protein